MGTVTGGVLTVWLAFRADSGNDMGVAFSLLYFGPLGLLVGLIAGIVCGLKAFDFVRWPDPAGALRVKKTRLRAAVVLGPLLATGLPLYSLMHAHDPPPDDAMLAHFRAHRAQFDELAQMAEHDPHIVGLYPLRVNYDNQHSAHISASRMAAYLQKLRAAGVPDGFEAGDGEIDFLFWSDSTVKGKNFAYLPKPPPSPVPSLDDGEEDDGEEGIAYFRHIDGAWYLRYEFYGD